MMLPWNRAVHHSVSPNEIMSLEGFADLSDEQLVQLGPEIILNSVGVASAAFCTTSRGAVGEDQVKRRNAAALSRRLAVRPSFPSDLSLVLHR